MPFSASHFFSVSTYFLSLHPFLASDLYLGLYFYFGLSSPFVLLFSIFRFLLTTCHFSVTLTLCSLYFSYIISPFSASTFLLASSPFLASHTFFFYYFRIFSAKQAVSLYIHYTLSMDKYFLHGSAKYSFQTSTSGAPIKPTLSAFFHGDFRKSRGVCGARNHQNGRFL